MDRNGINCLAKSDAYQFVLNAMTMLSSNFISKIFLLFFDSHFVMSLSEFWFDQKTANKEWKEYSSSNWHSDTLNLHFIQHTMDL